MIYIDDLGEKPERESAFHFFGCYVIPTQSLPPRRRGVGIHSEARCPLWIPVCTGMTDQLAVGQLVR